MFKLICSGIFFTIALSLSPLANAQGAAVNCGADASQCDDVCDGEKSWGFIKGSKFKDCATRCETQMAKQCPSKAAGAAGGAGVPVTKSVRRPAGKAHPRGKQYGYEKNADKVKGQHGDAVSAEHRDGKAQLDPETQAYSTEGDEAPELELEDAAEDLKEKAGKAKMKQGKGQARLKNR